MTKPRWQHLDTRIQADGEVVYHWRLDIWENVCEDSRQVVNINRDRCLSHAGGLRPCRIWQRTPECDHQHLDPEQQQPNCLTCGQVGEDVTAQVAAEMGA